VKRRCSADAAPVIGQQRARERVDAAPIGAPSRATE
jgi:hypothetical protein